MELLTETGDNEETVILGGSDHINDMARWKCNGSFVVVCEGKYHGRQIQAIGHYYSSFFGSRQQREGSTVMIPRETFRSN